MKIDLRSAAVAAAPVVAFLALGAAYVCVVPLWETPDEPSTVSTAIAVASVHRVPSPNDQPLFPGVTLNAKLHPPLYFALMGLVFAAAPDQQPEIVGNPFGGVSAEIARYEHAGGIPADRFRGAGFLRAVRGLSLLLGAGTLVVVWRIARLITPESLLAPFLAVAVFGLTPTFLFSHAAIDPLPMAVLLASLATYHMLRIHLHGSASPHAMRMLGVVLVVSVALRGTLVFLYLPALYLVWREKGRRLSLAGQVAVPTLLGMVWMFVLAPGPSMIAYRHLGAQLLKLERAMCSPAGLRTLVLHTKNSFWARFGWADLYAPAHLIDIYDLMTVGIVAGWIVLFARRRVPRGSSLLAAIAAIGLAGYVKGNLAQFDPQGRYLALLVAGYAPLGGLGLAAIVGAPRRRAVRSSLTGLVLAAILGVNGYSLMGVIKPAYGARLYPNLGVDAYQDQGAMLWGGVSAGQSFIARRPGLTRVELYFTPARHSPPRILEFRLMESPLIPEPLAIARVPYPRPGDRSHVGFSFVPLWDSENRSYYVRVAMVPEGDPVSAWYTLEDRYVGGSRYADDTPEPGDLRFTTYYVRPPTSEPAPAPAR